MRRDHSWADLRRVSLVAAVWIGVARLLAEHGWRVFPSWVLARLTLETYLTVIQLASAAIGLGLAFWLLRTPLDDLGWKRPAWIQLGGTILLAPAVYVLAVGIAVSLTLPMLKAEVLARGVRQVQESSGAFGHELRTAPLWLVVAWGVLVSPIAEELAFRGPAWSAAQRAAGALGLRSGSAHSDSSPGLPSELLRESLVLVWARKSRWWLAEGGAATIVTAGVFGAMHAGVPGAMGWIRVLSATLLGFACGQGRQATGSVLTPIALHAIYNLLAVANARRWFVVEGWLKFRGVPWPVIFAAIACVLVFASVAAVRRLKRVRNTMRESTVPAPGDLP